MVFGQERLVERSTTPDGTGTVSARVVSRQLCAQRVPDMQARYLTPLIVSSARDPQLATLLGSTPKVLEDEASSAACVSTIDPPPLTLTLVMPIYPSDPVDNANAIVKDVKEANQTQRRLFTDCNLREIKDDCIR